MDYSSKVITTLNHKLMKLDHQKYDLGLINNNGFTRKPKKLSFIEDMKLIMSMSPTTYKAGLLDYFNFGENIVSSSGYVQSRQKIKEDAFKYLLDYINKAYPCTNTYKGYRLLAVDGSDISISYNPNEYDTTMPNYKYSKTVNQLHINALYDVLNSRYLDTIIQGVRSEDERQAMIDMAEQYKGEKAIFIADRGYEAYNLYEHIRLTGNYFLIRIKDGSSRLFNQLPKRGEYDKEFNVIFTKTQNAFTRQNNMYIPLMSNQRFDYLNENKQYNATYRIIRLRINSKDKYETIITNLKQPEISTDDIKKIYSLRWNIETSFKYLKYSINLNALHSKRRDFIKQEIWAKLIMFNISTIIINYIQKHKLSKINKRKYEYKLNISCAMFIIIKSIRKGGIPPNLLELITKELLPIRPNRSYKRNVRSHTFVSFGYRFK